jgi:hypothetical protein
MKTFMVALALAALPAATPAMAQGNLANPPVGTGTGAGIDSGAGNRATPGQKALPEIERQRSKDLQRGAPPMATDPRLGPPSASDSGGPGRVPGAGGGRGLGPVTR